MNRFETTQVDRHGASAAPFIPASERDRRLAERFRASGDVRYRNALVDRHARLAWHVAWKYAGRGVPVEDLFQEGALGLIRAAETFDPARATKFSTYAVSKITSQIVHYLRDQKETIRQPAWVQSLGRKSDELMEGLRAECGAEPSRAEVAARLEISVEKLARILDARRLGTVVSLEEWRASRRDPEEQASGSWQEKLSESPPESRRVSWEERIELRAALSALPADQARMVYLYFYVGLTGSEISARLGVPRWTVHQQLAAALKQLRSSLAA